MQSVVTETKKQNWEKKDNTKKAKKPLFFKNKYFQKKTRRSEILNLKKQTN